MFEAPFSSSGSPDSALVSGDSRVLLQTLAPPPSSQSSTLPPGLEAPFRSFGQGLCTSCPRPCVPDGETAELEERDRGGKERENGNTRGNRGTDVHQKGGRGKPLRLICLPAQLDYFLGDCRLALGSLQCPGVPPARPPACAHRRRCRKWDGDPSGPGLARDLIC